MKWEMQQPCKAPTPAQALGLTPLPDPSSPADALEATMALRSSGECAGVQAATLYTITLFRRRLCTQLGCIRARIPNKHTVASGLTTSVCSYKHAMLGGCDSCMITETTYQRTVYHADDLAMPTELQCLIAEMNWDV